MIPLWKGKNPIYFGVITIIPFDNLYRRAYFVMHMFLVQLCHDENKLHFYSASSLKQQSTVRYVTLIAYTDTTNLCSNTSVMMHEPTNLCSNTSLMMHEPTNMCSNTSLIMHEPTNLCSNTSLMMHEPTNLCSNTSLMMHA